MGCFGTTSTRITAATTPKAPVTMYTPRQSVTASIHSTGAVAASAPTPPTASTQPLISGSRSTGNHMLKALNEAIRQAETPRPMSARATTRSVTSSP